MTPCLFNAESPGQLGGQYVNIIAHDVCPSVRKTKSHYMAKNSFPEKHFVFMESNLLPV